MSGGLGEPEGESGGGDGGNGGASRPVAGCSGGGAGAGAGAGEEVVVSPVVSPVGSPPVPPSRHSSAASDPLQENSGEPPFTASLPSRKRRTKALSKQFSKKPRRG